MLTALLLLSCGRRRPTAPSGPNTRQISVDQLRAWMQSGRTFILIDVRTDDEWQAGHAAAAVHIRRVLLADSIAEAAPHKHVPVVLYCLTGKRSESGVDTLNRLGYTAAYSLQGGFPEYQKAGLPVDP